MLALQDEAAAVGGRVAPVEVAPLGGDEHSAPTGGGGSLLSTLLLHRWPSGMLLRLDPGLCRRLGGLGGDGDGAWRSRPSLFLLLLAGAGLLLSLAVLEEGQPHHGVDLPQAVELAVRRGVVDLEWDGVADELAEERDA